MIIEKNAFVSIHYRYIVKRDGGLMEVRITLRAKVFLAITCINIIAILTIAIMFYQSSARFLENQYAKSLLDHAYIVARNLDKAFQDTYYSVVIASFDPGIRESLKKFRMDMQDASLLEISEILHQYKAQNDLIDSVCIFLPDDNRLVKSTEYNPIQKLSGSTTANLIEMIQRNTAKHALSPFYMIDNFSVSPKHIFMYAKPAELDESGEVKAWLLVTMDERNVYYRYLDDMAHYSGTMIYLLNQKGDVVLGNYKNEYFEDFINTEVFHTIQDSFSGKSVYQKDNVKYLIIYIAAPFSKYHIVLCVNQDKIIGNLLLLQFSVCFLALAVIIVSFIPAYYMAKRVNKPVENLERAMEKVGYGDLTATVTVYAYDEIGRLSIGFNSMVQRIKRLIDELVAERSLKKQAELNALQYQITPHFIYNTLNSIRFAAILQGAKNIGDLLGKFIDLLQVSSNRKGSFALFHEELNTLKNYIALQQFRHMDSFTVEYQINEAVNDYYVPRLILQPLVENSIIHGPSEEKPICHIIIGAKVEHDLLILTVEDDGKGMSDGQIAALCEQNSIVKGEYTHIGIFNIKERLSLYYGNKGILQYFSDGSTFTRAVIMLPASKNSQEYGV